MTHSNAAAADLLKYDIGMLAAPGSKAPRFPRHSFLGRCNGVRTTSDFGTICGLHLLHYVSNMDFNGALAHLQCVRDGLVSFT